MHTKIDSFAIEATTAEWFSLCSVVRKSINTLSMSQQEKRACMDFSNTLGMLCAGTNIDPSTGTVRSATGAINASASTQQADAAYDKSSSHG